MDRGRDFDDDAREFGATTVHAALDQAIWPGSDYGLNGNGAMSDADWQRRWTESPDPVDCPREHGPEAEIVDPDKPRRPPIAATPYQCRDPHEMPRRPWVFGRKLLRGSMSNTIAPGAVGKTAYEIGEALSLATGRSLLGKTVWEGPKRVWIWNLEDPGLELAYLIEAARLHWGISEEDIGGRLFVDSALEGAELCIAIEDHTGFRILEPVIDELVAELVARQIDVLIVDPFVSCHTVSENNNSAIDRIAKKWARVAVQANCAVDIVHHTRKLNGAEVNAESSRGAVALPNAARSVEVLNRMTTEEATRWGIEGEERRRYFRAYDDKPNRAPPSDKSDWYRLASIDLGNWPNGSGDSIQVVIPWTPPDAFTGVTVDHLRKVQAAVLSADYRKDSQSPDWVGFAVADVLDLDVSDRKSKDAARVKHLIKEWLQTGALVERKASDSKGMERTFIGAGTPPEEESSR